MRLAIFGNKGYLGSQLEFWFRNKGYDVVGFDKPECDITDSRFWQTFSPSRFDRILFFSGLTGTDKSFEDAEKYLMVNELGLLKLLTKLSPLGKNAPKVIFPSSRLVYKGKDSQLAEDSEKETKTVYAVNKLACEGYLSAYGNRYGLPYVVLRICVPYGSLVESEYSYGTIGFFEHQAKTGKPITLFGGGEVRRTFTHVKDICTVVDALLSSGSGVYNIGGQDMRIRDVAEPIAQKYGVEVQSVPWPETALALESGSTVFDSTKLDDSISFDGYSTFRI